MATKDKLPFWDQKLSPRRDEMRRSCLYDNEGTFHHILSFIFILYYFYLTVLLLLKVGIIVQMKTVVF